MSKELIEKIEKELEGEPADDAEAGYDAGILAALSIINDFFRDKAVEASGQLKFYPGLKIEWSGNAVQRWLDDQTRGMVLVPLEPTEEMVVAAGKYRSENCCYSDGSLTIAGQYKVMIASDKE